METRILVVTLAVVSRRLREEQHANSKYETRKYLDGKGDTPRGVALAGASIRTHVVDGMETGFRGRAARVGYVWRAPRPANVLSPILEPVGDEDTKGNGELL